MSVFKRLGNVARGKMKELGRSLEAGFDGAFGEDAGPVDPDAPFEERPSRPGKDRTPDEKRVLLERLKAEGLLTEEEFDTKLAELEPEVPTPSRPKKRHL